MRLKYLPLYARRAILIGLVLITGALQNRIFSQGFVFLLIPMASAAAFFEREFAGAAFGLLCGALWDLASPAPDGVFALTFAVGAAAVGLLARYKFRRTLPAALTLHAGFTLLVGIVILLMNCLRFRDASVLPKLALLYAPRLLATVAVFPVYYFPLAFLNRRLAIGSPLAPR